MQKNLLAKVLMIEDNDTFFNLLKPRLTKNGIFLLRARNGEEGLKKAKIEQPELIITDVVMPKINGFEVIRILKGSRYTSDIKIVVLTDYGETNLVYDKEFLSSLGVNKYLVKSRHSPTEMVKEIISILN